ncbi:hypothetical protein AB0N77_21970 [Streptomyces misionensis]|uniref:hypothetical protein n=1 Tax=Streptomyces misionensis TaxID=67331 RepID=UPI003422DC2D
MPAGRGGFARRLAARWARVLPTAVRDGDWLVVAEELLEDAVDAEHVGHSALQAVLERALPRMPRRPGPGTLWHWLTWSWRRRSPGRAPTDCLVTRLRACYGS